MSWIKVYNEGKELKEFTGGSTMKKARKTTLEERIAIVTDCLSHNRNYGAMALKYNCSYQQVRNWVDRYEKMGECRTGGPTGKACRISTKPYTGRRTAGSHSRTGTEEQRSTNGE